MVNETKFQVEKRTYVNLRDLEEERKRSVHTIKSLAIVSILA